MNCAVLDKKNGIVMKLGENNEILRACYRFRRLNDEEIV